MKTIYPALTIVAVVGLCLAAGFRAHGSMKPQHEMAAGHRFVLPGDLKWAAPPSLPPGARMAIVDGDPSKPGPFAFRLILPANYRVPPHFHPADERVTVLKGTFYMGRGEKFSASSARALPAGGFTTMPAGMRHFAFSKQGCTVQVHGMGPWGITYVNPNDDPRKKR